MNPVYLEKRAGESVDRLADLAVAETAPIDAISWYRTQSFARPEDLPLEEFTPCEVGIRWTRNRRRTTDDRRRADVDMLDGSHLPEALSLGDNAWFRLQFAVPDSMAGHPVDLEFVARPATDDDWGQGPSRVECLCYRDGTPWKSFDNGHDTLRLTECAEGGETFDLLVEAGTTTLWGLLDVEEFELTRARLVAERPAVRRLQRNVAVLQELQAALPEESLNREKILRAVVDASHAVAFEAASGSGSDSGSDGELERSATRALEALEERQAALTSELSGHQLTAIGHSHLDLAYLWPWSETVRKGARTFANVLRLMEVYEEHPLPFMQSQPHLYELVRTRYPDLFDRVDGRIDEGRWHPTGGMWVEPDLNLVGGESLARQFLLGKRYFRSTFGRDPSVVFLPDVFGYGGGLPGIARAADCPYFFTQKIDWNEVNEFPHTSFRWEGIRGEEVLAHIPPGETYKGQTSVEEVRRSVTNHDQHHVHGESVYPFGWGDGGGGPTREMVERLEVIDRVGSLPDVTFDSLEGFFERLADLEADLPTWTGEIYLEKHRGTLTTQARIKRHNRRGEAALQGAELWASVALAVDGTRYTYPHERLQRAWKTLLFNQFHDILPGSSVADVYADAERDYERMFEAVDAVTDGAVDALVGPTGPSALVAVRNPVSWRRDALVEIAADRVAGVDDVGGVVGPDDVRRPVQSTTTADGEDRYLFEARALPPFGIETYELVPEAPEDPIDGRVDASDGHLANDRLHVDIRADGTIDVVDVESGRRPFESPGNRLIRYRDHPEKFEAWDIEADLYETGDPLPPPTETEVVESGPLRATVRQVRRFGDSEIVQDISLSAGSAQLRFDTRVDWHEEEALLKTHFPIDVHTNEATYEGHFGHVTRPTHDNTSWDEARYEVPHHRWVDVAEPGYGVALLNDCKYGANVDGTDLSLSLLRATTWPDPTADRGPHSFSYAVYPHEGCLGDSGVIERGYELNRPAVATPVRERVSVRPLRLDAEGVIVESVKRAEDADGRLIVRLYEAWGRETDATVSFGFDVAGVAETNLVEDHRTDLQLVDDDLELTFDAFEIKTIRVSLPQ
jgi:alpha-mannosidase